MADTTFTNNTTVVDASWLNDVNDHVYNDTPVAPATSPHPSLLSRSGGNMTGPINGASGTTPINATTTNLWTVGNTVTVTGVATTITNFAAAPQAGSRRFVEFPAGTILTNNANITVQGGASYTTQSNDEIEVHAVTTTTFEVWIKKSNGRVPVASYGAAFSARQSAPQAIAATSTRLTPSTELYDSGNNYSAGLFTAPETGLYFFSWGVLLDATVSVLNSYLRVNGVQNAQGTRVPMAGGFAGSSGSAGVYLTAGDTVDAAADATPAANTNAGASSVHFSGALIRPLV